MKIEVFDKPKVPEKSLLLKLVNMIGGVKLIAVNELGESLHCGNILFIDKSGIQRAWSVSEKLGLPLSGSRVQSD